MSTYWLLGRKERVALNELQCNSFSWDAPIINIQERKLVPDAGPFVPLVRSNSIGSTSSLAARRGSKK